jgi:hypothetical protein
MLAFEPKFLGKSRMLAAGDVGIGRIPLLIQDSSGLPLQQTWAIALIEKPDGGITAKYSDYTSAYGDTVLDVGSSLENQPTTFVIIPPKSHLLPISLADVTRKPDGSVTLEVRREDTGAERAIKYAGILLAGAGLGILGYLGLRSYQAGMAK